MPGISYDESGSLAGYFGVTFLAVVLVPATWIVFRPAQSGEHASWPGQLASPSLTFVSEPVEPLCKCTECRANQARIAQRKSSAHRRRFAKRLVPLIAAWALFAYLSYGISTAPRAPGGVVYNPFEILGLSDSSTEKQIKKHYKKLSLRLCVLLPLFHNHHIVVTLCSCAF
jgi:translocation protein SEC63